MGKRMATALATLVTVAASLPAAALPASAAPAQDPGPTPPDKIHPAVRGEMERAGATEPVVAVVVLGARPPVAALADHEVPGALAAAADATQAPLAEAVRDAGGAVLGSFWLQNMLLVEAPAGTLAELSGAAAVDRIIPNLEVELPDDEGEDEDVVPAQTGEATWGVERIRADAVHDERGITGAGVRIAVLDTGVDIDHPDLAGKLVTDDAADPAYPGGWIEFDPAGQPVAGSLPRDSSFHGTHVAGTALGGDASGTQIGVAPDAQLMAAMVIPGGSGTFTQVIAGMQWTLDPVDAAGNPAGAPADVINLSLGGCGLAQEMVEPTRNLRAAGVFPAFAIGNDDINCPSCGPVDSASPGNVYEAVGVGATDVADDVAERSCGAVLAKADWPDPPADWPDQYVKPDLSAPGVEVDSADPGGGYRRLSGTSMATPHVAGAAALMYQARVGIGVDDALQTLAATAFFDERHGAQRPNPRFGWGRIDAYEAVAEAALRGGIAGVVTAADTGAPVAGARVTRVDNGRWVDTDQAGRFELRLPAGTHTVEISQFGYEVSIVDGIEVAEDGFTTVDRQLHPTPRGKITGTVTYGPTGSAVPGAMVRVQDVPVDLSARTDDRGRYAIADVPQGSYSVVASTPDRARSEPVQVTVGTGDTPADLRLERPPATELVSLTSDGRQGNAVSWWPSVSADGRFVAFGSLSNNLVDDDTNDEWDLFVTDRLTGLTERVSLARDGGQGDSFSLSPRLTPDGRHLGFNSAASNLVEDDTNEVTDTFVRDLREGVNERLSVASGGGEADGNSGSPALSAGGRYAAFGSDATNLVPGDTNDRHDVFVRDRVAGTTERISVGYDGSEADNQSRDPSMSADGRYVAFHSDATNLVEGDDNGRTDVFVHDRETGETIRISGPGESGTRAPNISADGRVVAFNNAPSTFGIAQIYAHDLTTGETELVSVAHDGTGGAGARASAPSLSADGNLVTFYSFASNLVEGDTNGRDDIFVRDRGAGTTERVSLAPDGQQADDSSALPVVSPDGRYVAYQSDATNLAGGDTNGIADVFVHDRDPGQPEARFAVWDLEVRQPVASPRQPVVVMVKVKNVGDAAGAYDAVLRIDGQVEDAVTVELGPDSWRWVRFWVSRTEPGDYQIAVGPTTSELTVRER